MGGSQSRTKLKKSEMRLLRENTKFTDQEIRKWYKAFKTACPSGHLTSEEFVRFYEDFFPGGDAKAFCEHAFRSFDTNKSGHVDFNEFLLAINIMTHGSPEEKLEWAFNMYDIDGSGTIEVEEMIRIMQAVHDMFQTNTEPTSALNEVNRKATAIFERMDSNNDKRLTFDEFLQGCMSDKDLCRLLTSGSS